MTGHCLLLSLAVHVSLMSTLMRFTGTQDEGGDWTLNRAVTVGIPSLRHTHTAELRYQSRGSELQTAPSPGL